MSSRAGILVLLLILAGGPAAGQWHIRAGGIAAASTNTEIDYALGPGGEVGGGLQVAEKLRVGGNIMLYYKTADQALDSAAAATAGTAEARASLLNAALLGTVQLKLLGDWKRLYLMGSLGPHVGRFRCTDCAAADESETFVDLGLAPGIHFEYDVGNAWGLYWRAQYHLRLLNNTREYGSAITVGLGLYLGGIGG
jgi:hypothetical protein